MKNIGIKEIAAAANVSQATAARAMSNKGYVSEEKRLLVSAAAKELGYVPNMVARGLRKRQTNLIGHVLPVSTENPFFARVCHAFETASARAGFHVVTAITQMDPALEVRIVENLVSLMVDAIVFSSTRTDAALVDWVLSRNIPVIMIERPLLESGTDVILVDSFAGVRAAVEHMIGRGHRDIGFVGLRPEEHEVERQRYEGYVSTMKKHGLKISKRLIQYIPDYFVEYGRTAMEGFLAMKKPPTALFAASDVVACGILQVLYEHKISVPSDISLIGFDDTLSAHSSPALTTLDLRLGEIGETVVEMILERARQGRNTPKTVTITPRLVDRGSVAPPRPAGDYGSSPE